MALGESKSTCNFMNQLNGLNVYLTVVADTTQSAISGGYGSPQGRVMPPRLKTVPVADQQRRQKAVELAPVADFGGTAQVRATQIGLQSMLCCDAAV